jgi:hypothetical protein
MPAHLRERLSSQRMDVDMQKQKWQKRKRQKGRRQLIQVSSKQSNSHYDPLWHQTPEMGVEALIATIDSKRELHKALQEIVVGKKLEKRSLSEKN